MTMLLWLIFLIEIAPTNELYQERSTEFTITATGITDKTDVDFLPKLSATSDTLSTSDNNELTWTDVPSTTDSANNSRDGWLTYTHLKALPIEYSMQSKKFLTAEEEVLSNLLLDEAEGESWNIENNLLKKFKREIYSKTPEDKMEITSIKMVEDSLQIGSTAHWKVTSFSEKLLICYQTKNKIYLLLTSPTFQVISRYGTFGQGPCHFIKKRRSLLFVYVLSSNQIRISKLTLSKGGLHARRVQLLQSSKEVPKFASWEYNKKLFLMMTLNVEESKLYIWQNGKFELFQILSKLSSEEACHFLVQDHSYVALTGRIGENDHPTIYKYSHSRRSYIAFQELKISEATAVASSVNAFSIGGETYLVVTSFCEKDAVTTFCNPETESTIFKYDGQLFRPFQNIVASGAMQSAPIQFGKESYLLILSPLVGLSVYQYKEGKFEEILPWLDKWLLEEGLTDLVTFESYSEVLVGVRSLRRVETGPKFFIVNFGSKLLPESELDESLLRKSCMYALHLASAQLEQSKKAVLEALESKSLYLEGEKTLQTYHVDNEGTHPDYPQEILENLDGSVQNLDLELTRLKQDIDGAEARMKNAINISEAATWPDNLHMSSIVIFEAKAEELSVQYVNDLPVPAISDLIPFDQSNLHLGLNTKTFSDIEIQNLKIEKLNGFAISSYLTLSGDHFTSAQFTMSHLATSNLKVGGLIDGVDFNKEKLFLITNDQISYGGLLTCDSINAVNLETEFINEVNVKKLMGKDLRNNSFVTLEGDLEISGDLILHGALQTRTVFGVDLKSYVQDVLFLNSKEHQIITGRYTIEKIKTKDLYLEDTLNNLSLLDSVFINHPIKFYHIPKATFEDLYAKEITVDKSLNEIKISGKDMNLVTLEDDQTIIGSKIFRNMHLGNSITYRHVSGYNFTLNMSGMNANMTTLYKASLKSKDVLNSLTSDIKTLNKLRLILLKLSYTKPASLHPSYLEQDWNVYSPILKTVRNLLATLEELTKALKTNFNAVQEISLSLEAESDMTNLKKLSMFKTVPMSLLNSVREFFDTLEDASNRVEKLILWKKRTIITMSKTSDKFDSHIEEELKKNQLSRFSIGSIVTGKTAGFDLRKMPLKRANVQTLNKTVILQKIRNADGVIFMKNLETKIINDFDIKKMVEQAVPLHATKTNLSLIFEGGVLIKNDLITPKLNEHVTSNLATIYGTNVFEKEIEFQTIFCQGDVQMEGKVNGFDINKLASDIVTVTGPQIFNTPIRFTSAKADSVKAQTVILGDTSLQDFVLKRKTTTLITGQKTFKGLSVSGPQVTVKNLDTKKLGKIKLEESPATRAVTKDLKIGGRTELKSLSVRGNIEVRRKLINSKDSSYIDLTRLYQKTVHYNKLMLLGGSFLLKGKVFARNLIFKKSFDDMSAEEFSQGWVTRDSIQTLHGLNTFKTLRVKNLFVENGMLQGVNLRDLVHKTVKVDEDYSFEENAFIRTWISPKPIEVKGLVQGWNLTKDAIVSTDSPVIKAPKTFVSPVKILKNVNVDGLVNNMNLGALCKSILGQLRIKGSVHFEKDVTAERVQHGNTFIPNEDSNYWMIDKPVTLSSEILFERIIANSVNIKNKFNGEEIREIFEGPIPKECNAKVKLGKWKADTVVCENLKASNISVKTFANEDATILEKLLLNTVDQVFPNDLSIGDLTITESIEMKKLNGFSLSEFCLKGSPCHIDASKRFTDLTVLKDWDISNENFVNDLSINKLKNASATSSVTVIIKGPLRVPSLRIAGLVNGIRFDSASIMSLSKDQRMNGSLHITNKNGLALRAGEVRILDGRFNNLNVSPLRLHQVDPLLKEPTSKIKDLAHKYKSLAQHVTNVHSVLKEQPLSFDGWEKIEEFDGYSNAIPLENAEDTNIPFLAVFDSKKIDILHYNSINKSRLYATIRVDCPTDTSGFQISNELFFAASVTCSNSSSELEKAFVVSPETMGMEEKISSYIWKISSNGPFLFAKIATGESSQVLWFKMSGRNCLLFVSKASPRQNVICEDNNSLILQQSFHTGKILKAVHIGTEDKLSYLIIATEAKKQVPFVHIYHLNTTTDHYQNIHTIQAERLVWISAINYWNSLFIVTVHSPFGGSGKGKIKLYRLNPENQDNLQLQECFETDEPIQTALLVSPNNNLYLLVLDKNGFITRYVKKLAGNFQRAGSLHIPNARSLHAWIWRRDDGYNLAISQRRENASKIVILKPRYKGWFQNL